MTVLVQGNENFSQIRNFATSKSHLKQLRNSSVTRDSLYKFLFACCLGLSPAISSQFTLEAENRKKIIRTAYILRVQDRSRSSMYVDTPW